MVQKMTHFLEFHVPIPRSIFVKNLKNEIEKKIHEKISNLVSLHKNVI